MIHIIISNSFVYTSYTHLKDYSEFINTENYLPLQNTSYEKMEFLGDKYAM